MVSVSSALSVRRRHDQLGEPGERHDADARPRRLLLDEGAGCLLATVRRLGSTSVAAHRAGHVEGPG